MRLLLALGRYAFAGDGVQKASELFREVGSLENRALFGRWRFKAVILQTIANLGDRLLDLIGIERMSNAMWGAAFAQRPCDVAVWFRQCQHRPTGAEILVKLRGNADLSARRIEQ